MKGKGMDNTNPGEIIKALSAPFPEDQVYHRVDERTKKNLSYISAHNIYIRLNSVAPGWGFEVVSTTIQQVPGRNGQQPVAIVTGKMTIPGVGSRMGMGTNAIYAPDDFKGAITDCIKRCAALFGVALYLYGGGDDNFQQQGNYNQPQQGGYQQQGGYNQQPGNVSQMPQQQRQNYPQQQQGYGGGGSGSYDNSQPRQYDPSRDTGELATEPQRKKLGFEISDKGIQIQEAANRAQVPINGGIDEITKRQASAIIDWLTTQPSAQNQQGGDGNYGGGQGGGQGSPDDWSNVPF